MSLGISQNKTALAAGLTASFLGVGGTAPLVYSVRQGGAGGTIDSSTGVYTAPVVVPSDPRYVFDTIQVKDSLGAIATAKILVASVLMLVCDIIQSQMALANGRVYLWDQKINQPTDSEIYVAVAEISCKPFGNTNSHDGSGSGLNSVQSVNMYSQLQIDIISRGPGARDRKAEVLMALNSDYSQQQQEANSFNIGQLPPNSQFVNLSSQDGADIPYRYTIGVAIQYFVTKIQPVGYFDDFDPVEVTTEA